MVARLAAGLTLCAGETVWDGSSGGGDGGGEGTYCGTGFRQLGLRLGLGLLGVDDGAESIVVATGGGGGVQICCACTGA